MDRGFFTIFAVVYKLINFQKNMLYSTLVDKSEATMNLLIARAEEFDQDRVLDGLDTRHYSVMEVKKMTAFVNEHLARMQQEVLALQEFAQDFNRQYATDNNACYDTATRLFSRLRSSIACTRRMYQKFCPRTRRRGPVKDGVEQPLSAWTNSLLGTPDYGRSLFGTQTYDTCVDDLCRAMEQFFAGLVIAMKLCRDVMQQERAIRRDAHRVRSIYDECYRRVLDEAGSLITMLQQTNGWQPDEMTRRKTATPSDDALLCDRFHTMTKSDFQRHAVTDHLSRGRHAGLTDVESLLWNNDREQVARVRQAIAHFDEVEPAGQHDRATGRQKLSSVHVAMLMQWCHITGTGKEKQFVEEYFNKTYQGRYQPVGSSAVNAAKTRITPAAYVPFAAHLDALLSPGHPHVPTAQQESDTALYRERRLG